MKQEYKELLLQDLCARMPYKIMCHIEGEEDPLPLHTCIVDIYTFDFSLGENMDLAFRTVNEIKPYLFPLSSITEEQAKELFNIFGLVCPSTEENYIKINECTGITFFLLRGFDVETHLDKLVDWLNKNHFDYRGLIEKGLALDATELNIY